jgi:lantibiotic modifying enzyme
MTRAVPFRPLDHLCCGNLGRAEILLCAHQALGGGELLDDARSLGERTMARAEAEGGFALCRPGETPGLRLAFFHGLSGIGYALLHLTGSRPLPCILCLE